jgi:chorismate mutase
VGNQISWIRGAVQTSESAERNMRPATSEEERLTEDDIAREKLVALSLAEIVSETFPRKATRRPFGLTPVDWVLLLLGLTLVGLVTLLV